MILAGIIFIFNLILAYLSIDISKLDSVTEQLKIGMFSSIFVLSLTLFIFAFRQNRNINKIYQKICRRKNKNTPQKNKNTLFGVILFFYKA